MSEHLHPDSLSAFAEGVLPEHERAQCLAHLAECSRCREIVFLAQEPPLPAAPKPAPAWRRWFAPIPVLAAAAAACVAVVGLSLYLHHPTAVPQPAIVAHVNPAPPPIQAPPEPPPVTQKAQPRTTSRRPAPMQPSTDSTIVDATAPKLPPPPTVRTQTEAIPAPLAADRLSGISGAVTDPTGAAVPGATVTLRQPAGTFTRDARTDAAGQFQLTGVPPGRYELQVDALGFKRTLLQQVELPPLQMASVKPVLEIGAVTESVEVSAGASVVETSSAEVSRTTSRRKAVSLPTPLPTKLPTAITVTSGKVTLAVDSNGALFVSRNAGKTWKVVKPAWKGKVAALITLPDPAAFQLTTDGETVWLSRDGTRWSPAPPPK
jgi:hypothetical protein